MYMRQSFTLDKSFLLDFLILSDSNASDGEMTVFLFVMRSFRRDTVIRYAIQIRQTNASFFYLILCSLSFPLKLRDVLFCRLLT